MQIQTNLLMSCLSVGWKKPVSVGVACCVVCVLSTTALAAIRVYDPVTKKDVLAPTNGVQQEQPINTEEEMPTEEPAPTPSIGGVRQHTPAQVEKQAKPLPKPLKLQDVMQPDYEAQKAARPTKAPLGHAFIFAEVDKFPNQLGINIKKAKEFKGLYLKTFLKQEGPTKYMALATKSQEATDGLSFTVDSQGKKARLLNIDNYHTIYYVDPNGARRQYDSIKEFDKFLRHVSRIARSIKR